MGKADRPAAFPPPPDSSTRPPSLRPPEMLASTCAFAGRPRARRRPLTDGRDSLERKISPHRDLPPRDPLRRYTAGPRAPLAAPCAPVENRGGARRTSHPSTFAEPAAPPVGPKRSRPAECLTSALPRRPAWGFPPASPLSLPRSRSATVPAFLAPAASGIPVTGPRSSRRLLDSPGWPCLVVMPAGSFPLRRPLPSVVPFSARLSGLRFPTRVSVPFATVFGAALLLSVAKPSTPGAGRFSCRGPLLSRAAYWPFPLIPLAGYRSGLPPLFWSTTPSAAFCATVRMKRFTLSHVL